MARKRRDTSLAKKVTLAQTGASTHPAAAEFLRSGTDVINIPEELFGYREHEILRRVISMLREGRAPGNDLERVFAGVFKQLDRNGWSLRPEALLLGIQLAYANENGEKIQTHPRDLAKDAEVRYQDLLRVRKLATEEIRALNLKKKINPHT